MQMYVYIQTPLVTLAGHSHPVTTAAWPQEEEFLTAGYDHSIRVWDTPTGVNKSTLVRDEAIPSLLLHLNSIECLQGVSTD